MKVQHKNSDFELHLSDDIELQDVSGPDLESARTVHEEARSVLDQQTKLLDDVDDKAARTVRITVLLVGAVLGATSFENTTGVSLSSSYIMWGTAYLISSIALGMKTYNVSEPYLGPSPADLRKLLNDTDGEIDMLTFLVEEGFTEWISEMDFLNRVNGWYLDLTQWSLVIGITMLALGLLNEVLTSDQSPRLKSHLTTLDNASLCGMPLLAIPLVILLVLALSTLLYSVYHKYKSP